MVYGFKMAKTATLCCDWQANALIDTPLYNVLSDFFSVHCPTLLVFLSSSEVRETQQPDVVYSETTHIQGMYSMRLTVLFNLFLCQFMFHRITHNAYAYVPYTAEKKTRTCSRYVFVQSECIALVVCFSPNRRKLLGLITVLSQLLYFSSFNQVRFSIKVSVMLTESPSVSVCTDQQMWNTPASLTKVCALVCC